MKILVLSDSHGAVSPMEQAVEQTSPDLILHLGDCWRDGERLHDRFPSIPLEQVPGNCDFRPTEPAERLLELRGKRILLCHGHTYGVKQSLVTAGFAAEEQQLDLFLFGHTHRPLAGPDTVPESRQHRCPHPPLLWRSDHPGRTVGRPDMVARVNTPCQTGGFPV